MEQEKQPFKQRDHLEYPELTMFQMVERMGREHPAEPAYEFYGRKTSYQSFVNRIEQAARAFAAMGIKRGDAVTICMPNTPQAIDCFYALNRIGAVSNMVHPLSAESEIVFYLTISKSKAILTMDLFYEKVRTAVEKVCAKAAEDGGFPGAAKEKHIPILVARMQDELPLHLAAAFTLAKGRSFLRFPDREGDFRWKRFRKLGNSVKTLPENVFEREHTSVILYSGGTSGTPKGICLTDLNFNALGLQAVEAIGQEFRSGLTMLSCMPCFHGFGLGINIHTVLIHGACCILMPQFNGKTYAGMLIKRHPNFIAGVPTIFEALLNIPELDGKDLSFLKGMFCGGDSLTVELKRKIDTFLSEHGASIQVREGYGLTECVTASCLTPRDEYRPGSIGIPFPDTEYRIVKPGTAETVPAGTEGEIILKGPTLMLGYLDNPEETAETIRNIDGERWLHTGDLGYMDEDGYVYFRQRIKRMIITNGYNVYPGQIENVIDAQPEVAYSCVIGVKDPRRMQRVRAYVVLKEGIKLTDEIRAGIDGRLKANVAAYAIPKEILFRQELPKTLVGKVAYRVLEEEANAEVKAG